MRHPTCSFLIAITGLLSGCIHQTPSNYLSYRGLNPSPQVSDFEVCLSSGCRSISALAYTPEEWASITAIFDPTPSTAEEERERACLAIAMMETFIGAKNGTSADRPMNKRGKSKEGQLDCIAEAANTTVGLLLLQSNGFLRFHTVGFPSHRGFAQMKLPHNAATVREIETNQTYVIDSWYFANGEKPVTVPVSAWKTNYSPFKENPYHEPIQLPETP